MTTGQARGISFEPDKAQKVFELALLCQPLGLQTSLLLVYQLRR